MGSSYTYPITGIKTAEIKRNFDIPIRKNADYWRLEQTGKKPRDENKSKTGTVPKTLTFWESSKDQKEWEDSLEGQEATTTINELATGPVYEDTVDFSENPQPALGAKVVELVSWVYSVDNITDEKKAEIDSGFKKFQKAITTEAPESDGGIVAGWGSAEFDFEGVPSKRYTLLIGWKSVQAHYKCKTTPPFTDNIHWLMDNGHSKVEMVHFPYSQSIKD
ncbi:uncharacterized protein F4822DRAFT_425240 [Hypoxylon trugodes]|uniref:uncharacterized protein n=1 Tax=Hypoxylon trugodes TaxID=326681 RepID=UPI00219F529D|nr:uncharacterized protein F4822DRAFT_425240 [Hypoxylon trugodes]KAI1392022.1 hypothetical protein F4822DRAFT_425240 [Hypoxylon trugodes]